MDRTHTFYFTVLSVDLCSDTRNNFVHQPHNNKTHNNIIMNISWINILFEFVGMSMSTCFPQDDCYTIILSIYDQLGDAADCSIGGCHVRTYKETITVDWYVAQ